jgi:hypothetical protein
MDELLDNQDKRLQVKDSIVAFIDVLGFQDLIEKVKNDDFELNERLNHFYRAINPSFKYLRDTANFTQKYPFPEKCHVKIFTDNIAFTWELSNHRDGDIEIWQALKNLAYYQSGLAIEGYFSRGGIEIGSVYSDETTLFGWPIIASVQLEKERALFPRVIFGPEFIKRVIPKLSSNNYYRDYSPLNDLIIKSNDGEYFLNYLYTTKEMNDDNLDWDDSIKGYYPTSIKELNRHKTKVLENLEKYENVDSGKFRKYYWLGQYHNFFCTKYFSEDPSLLVEEINSNKSFHNPIE